MTKSEGGRHPGREKSLHRRIRDVGERCECRAYKPSSRKECDSSIAHCKSGRSAPSAFVVSIHTVSSKEPKMSFVASPADTTGRPQNCECHTSTSGNQLQQDSPLAVSPHNHCGDSCCRRCTSTIEKSISNRLQQLLAGRNLAQELPLFHGSRLFCLPLTGSSYRFLQHQFWIVNDYLSGNDVSNTSNRRAAIFHLRLIGARIRAARASSTNVAATREAARAIDSGCCRR